MLSLNEKIGNIRDGMNGMPDRMVASRDVMHIVTGALECPKDLTRFHRREASAHTVLSWILTVSATGAVVGGMPRVSGA